MEHPTLMEQLLARQFEANQQTGIYDLEKANDSPNRETNAYKALATINFSHYPLFCENLNCNYTIQRSKNDLLGRFLQAKFLHDGLYRRPDTCFTTMDWMPDMDEELKGHMIQERSIVWQQTLGCKGGMADCAVLDHTNQRRKEKNHLKCAATWRATVRADDLAKLYIEKKTDAMDIHATDNPLNHGNQIFI
jgi:hypothetical protein